MHTIECLKNNPKYKRLTRKQQILAGKKIRKLMHEGYNMKQAIAIAYKMVRLGQVGPHGGKKRNPAFRKQTIKDFLKVLKKYTGQIPKQISYARGEDNCWQLKYKAPSQPAFMFQDTEHFFDQLQSYLAREGFNVDIETNHTKGFAIVCLTGLNKQEKTPINSVAEEAFKVLRRKSEWMSDYTAGVVHPKWPAIFAARIYFDNSSVIIFLSYDNDKAIVFNDEAPEGIETSKLSAESVKNDPKFRSQAIRVHGGKDLNNEPAFKKFGLIAVMQTKLVPKNSGLRANDNMLVMGIRQSYSSYYTLIVLRRDKTLIKMNYDTISKKVKNFESELLIRPPKRTTPPTRLNPIEDRDVEDCIKALVLLSQFPLHTEEVEEHILDALESEGLWDYDGGVSNKGKAFMRHLDIGE